MFSPKNSRRLEFWTLIIFRCIGQRLESDRKEHDTNGHLVAESNLLGDITKEYIWLDDTPIAMIECVIPGT